MNDAQLEDLFGRSRGHETAIAPDFDTLLARRRGASLAGPFAASVFLALAAFTTVSVSEPPPPAVSLTEWRSPTAFLMRTTDEALWRDIPSLGPSPYFPSSPDQFSSPDKETP